MFLFFSFSLFLFFKRTRPDSTRYTVLIFIPVTVTSEQFAIYLTLCFSTPTRSSNDFRPPIEFLYRGHFAYNISEIIIYLGFVEQD